MTIMERIFAKVPEYYVEQYDRSDLPCVKYFKNFFEAFHYAEQFEKATVCPEGDGYIWFKADSSCDTVEKSATTLLKRICLDANIQQWNGGGARIRREMRKNKRVCIRNAWTRRMRQQELPF